ncbi:MAG: hypothetical protein IPJ32_09525 [Sphingobacteriaceae bacterium]|nr:hypothetical protein [Sphingobacteriaceae bacterium]
MQKIELLADVKENAFTNIKLKIELSKLTDELITNLENLFKQFNGKSNVEFL